MTTARFEQLFRMKARLPKEPIEQTHMDLAASIQNICEDVVLKSAAYARELTGQANLVMAGGVALNCVANGRLLRESQFEKIWVQPAAGDAGSALGAALLTWHHLLGKARAPAPRDQQRGSLLGDSFTNDEARAVLTGIGAVFEEFSDESALLERVAELLSQEHIIGWFQGRMEFGPRALGSRSILGDARPTNMQSRINQSVKFRESFRPFAPAVLQEMAAECFRVPNNGADSPYMLFVHEVADAWRAEVSAEQTPMERSPKRHERLSVRRSKIPAVTHVDHSARIQTVDEERHGRFYRLLREFFRLTGCPLVVNTSFNVADEPIVHNPDDAFHCFMKTQLDYLVVENLVLDKKQQPEWLRRHILEDY
jgi:carbamoyltransferase